MDASPWADGAAWPVLSHVEEEQHFQAKAGPEWPEKSTFTFNNWGSILGSSSTFLFFTDLDRHPSKVDFTFTSLTSLSKWLQVKIVNIDSQSGPHGHDTRQEQTSLYTNCLTPAVCSLLVPFTPPAQLGLLGLYTCMLWTVYGHLSCWKHGN